MSKREQRRSRLCRHISRNRKNGSPESVLRGLFRTKKDPVRPLRLGNKPILTKVSGGPIIPNGILLGTEEIQEIEGIMVDQELWKLLADINCAVIRFRGLYSAWSKEHGISYHELLVLYTIRDQGFCTQKQICDNYLLPRQTMNHVILDLRERGLLEPRPEQSAGREKAFVLSDKGRQYAAPLLEALGRMEAQAVQAFGRERVRNMVDMICGYHDVLKDSMDERV